MFSSVENILWASLVSAAVLYAVLYVFQSIGLYTIASREGYAHKWMAFVPFLNVYYIGVCSQKNKFLSIGAKKIGIIAAVYEAVVVGLYILFYVAWWYLEKSGGILRDPGGLTDAGITFPRVYLAPNFNINHPDLIWAGWCYNYLRLSILSWVNVGYMFVEIVLLNLFFQTYAPRHYIVYTILCVFFPIAPIFIFVSRNNPSVNFAEYTRMMQERIYRQYRSQQNDPYNGYNGRPTEGYRPEERPSSAPKDPFPEYSDKKQSGDGSFDEFKDN